MRWSVSGFDLIPFKVIQNVKNNLPRFINNLIFILLAFLLNGPQVFKNLVPLNSNFFKKMRQKFKEIHLYLIFLKFSHDQLENI